MEITIFGMFVEKTSDHRKNNQLSHNGLRCLYLELLLVLVFNTIKFLKIPLFYFSRFFFFFFWGGGGAMLPTCSKSVKAPLNEDHSTKAMRNFFPIECTVTHEHEMKALANEIKPMELFLQHNILSSTI